MAAIYRLKGLGWLTGCAIVAIGFYLVSSQVAAERKRLEQVDRRISSAERDIRALETEFDVRANLAQLERWNGNTLALTVPTARQFVADERALAALSPVQGLPVPGRDVPVQTAQLIVPAAPVAAIVPAVATASTATAAPAVVKVAAVQVAAATPITVTKVAARAAAAPVKVAKVAMLDRGLLSENTLGEILSGARAERSRLR
ncbi:hypothetical protein GCM10022253_28610 [Sphingomonas endophytica]|uniref:Colicin transporter n=1 Tax=Sphingomonas endophytica TaxID=869719 RepID=A0A7X0JAR7_9SPHN|nr:hypothetical protein [Sphingomonas endophytica]MBB5727164.1 hypothetical protein [Sphingomonas endophytica]MBB6503850.1 hypothetical protein [Sphingomonas endophytica]